MALKKSDLRAIFKNEDATIEERISEVLDMLHNEVDIVKDERDKLKEDLAKAQKNTNNDDADKWKEKYEKEHSDFEAFKNELTAKEAKSAKENALKELLKDSELSEKGQAMALKYSDINSLELDENGAIKNAKDILTTLKSEWADYAVESSTLGTQLKGKDGANRKKTNGSMSKEEIMKIKDTAERQKAIAENHELFGF